MKETVIIGAGMAGLLAASCFPESIIYENKHQNEMARHAAIMRFQSPMIGLHLGIPFKKVCVHKGIRLGSNFVQPSIDVCNMYSQKVAMSINDRSIWNINPVERWIAPDDFYDILLNMFSKRIEFNKNGIKVIKDDVLNKCNFISTIPLSLTAREFIGEEEFVKLSYMESKPITVRTYNVPSSNVYQTIYFPGDETDIYRASLNGKRLIIEYIGYSPGGDTPDADLNRVCCAFGFNFFGNTKVELISSVYQNYGKIKPIEDDNMRKQLIYELSIKHNIYSLGRFAIWKNIVMDDVWKDIAQIKLFMASDTYDRHKNFCKD